jgi:uncharacterized protein
MLRHSSSTGITGAFALVSVCLVFSSAHSQSFDCKKSATTVEREICSDKRLAGLDDQLANALRNLISTRPSIRATILADEHRWLHERDRRCNSLINPQSLFNCLTAEYSARIAEISVETKEPISQVPESRTAICRSIIERYRPLANAHPGKAPLDVLMASPNSGIQLASPLEGIRYPSTELVGWAATQKPPFSISPDLLKSLELYERTGGAANLIKAPGVDFYALDRSQGSAGCSDSRAFVVQSGVALPAVTPGDSEQQVGDCGGVAYGSIDRSPVAIAQHYDWRPGMAARIDIWTWDGQDFSHSCQVSLTYKPYFTRRTLNDWGETCNGSHCGDLRRASFKLAEAVETGSPARWDSSLNRLTATQKTQFDLMKQAFEAQDREPSSDDTFVIPFVHRDRLYLVSVGHYVIGWRIYADWRIEFLTLDDGKLTSRGIFSVGTLKGDLETVSVSE